MKVPSVIQWIVRRAHNAWNRWTLHAITGGKHRGMGWSAWSWHHGHTRIGGFMVWFIDLLFWPGHCREDYLRVMIGEPLVIDWRTVRAFSRVMALLMIWPALLVWWMV